MNLCLGGPTALCALRICRTHNISPRGKTVVRPASPAPYKRWTRRRLHEGLAPIKGLADAIGSEPIHVCVPSKEQRVQSSSARNIICAPAWYRSPFVRITDSLSYASPGLLLAQQAAHLTLVQTALIAYELCGTYAYDPCSGTMLYGVEPACTVDELLAFLHDMPGRIGARRKLERALYYVRDNSWSPMESALKITQPNTTNRIVYSHLKTINIFPVFLCSPVSFSTTRRTKYINPQIMKVKFAPCHKPVRNHTTKRFKIFLPLLHRLPPNGK